MNNVRRFPYRHVTFRALNSAWRACTRTFRHSITRTRLAGFTSLQFPWQERCHFGYLMVMVPRCVKAHSRISLSLATCYYVTRATSLITWHVIIHSTDSNNVLVGMLAIAQLRHSPSFTEPDSTTVFTRTPVLVQGNSIPYSQVLPSPHRPQPHEFVGNLFLCHPF